MQRGRKNKYPWDDWVKTLRDNGELTLWAADDYDCPTYSMIQQWRNYAFKHGFSVTVFGGEGWFKVTLKGVKDATGQRGRHGEGPGVREGGVLVAASLFGD